MKTISPEERKKKVEAERKKNNERTTWSYGLKAKKPKEKKVLKKSKLSSEEVERKKAEWDRERFAKEVEAAVDEFTKDHEPMLSLDDELVTKEDKEGLPWD